MATKKQTSTVNAVPKPNAKAKAKPKAAPKPKAEPKAKPKAEPKAKAAPPTPSDNYITELAADAIEIAMAESAGERGRNHARFQRGALMLRLEQMARVTKESRKEMLARVNARSLELAERHALLNYEPISDQEASMTKRVVERFGNSGEYPLVNAISRLTGQPVVNDAGETLTVNITDVAINKLYALADIDALEVEAAVSFAFRHTEQVVKKAKAVARRNNEPLADILAKVDAARVKVPHPATGDTIDVQPEGKEALEVLAALAGEAPAPDVVSIKTSRAFYDGFFVPLKKLMTAVVKRYKPEVVAASGDGMVSNVFVLETTLAQYFNIYEDEGVSAALGALVRAEVLSLGQASDFLGTHAYDATTDEWRAVADTAEAVEIMDELDDDDDDGDDDDWLESDDEWGDDEE